jgi:hypothetical protein
MWSIVTPKVFICFIKNLWNFLNSIDIYFSVDDFMLMGLYFSVLLLWFIEFVKKIDIHKMAWIVQKWPTIPINMSKFYIIKCRQAFLAITSYFKSHCLYAFSYFCGLKYWKLHCFSCQLTKINFGVPMQKYVSPNL